MHLYRRLARNRVKIIDNKLINLHAIRVNDTSIDSVGNHSYITDNIFIPNDKHDFPFNNRCHVGNHKSNGRIKTRLKTPNLHHILRNSRSKELFNCSNIKLHKETEMSFIEQLEAPGISTKELFSHYLKANVQIGLADIFEIKALDSDQCVETRFIEAQVGLRDNFNYRKMIEDIKNLGDWCHIRTHVTGSKSDVNCYIFISDKLVNTGDNTVAIILVTVSSDKTKATITSIQQYHNTIEEVLLKHIYDDQHPAFTLNITQQGIQSTRRSIRKSTAEIAKKEYYPFLNKTPEEYFDSYIKSKSGILFLIGPAGTGKSSFVRSLAIHSGKEVCTVYDEPTMRSVELMNYFYSSGHDLLVLEDADAFLTRREEGNKDLASLLNFVDGVVNDPDKKVIISTNLSSLSKVDPALLRKGRCYDIIEFRELSIEESITARNASGLPAIEFDKSGVLADVLCEDDDVLNNNRGRTFGFTGN